LHHHVTLRSKSGKGSSFALNVPLASAVPAAAARGGELRPPATPLEGVVAMCIENEPQGLAGVEALLAGWGWRGVAVPGLGAALAAVAGGAPRPDALLVDYHLDEGTGIEAVLALRAELGEEIPAALVTADRSPAVREEARASDIQVLNKPVKPAALRAFLAQWRVARPAAE